MAAISVIISHNDPAAQHRRLEVLRSAADPTLCVRLGVLLPGQQQEFWVWPDASLTVRELPL